MSRARIELRKTRENQGKSLSNLATLTGLSPSYLSEVESGKKVPSPESIRLISRALGQDPRKIFRAETIKALQLAREYYPEYIRIIDKELEVMTL